MPIMKNRHIYIVSLLLVAYMQPSKATVIEIDEQGTPHTHEVMDFRYLQPTHPDSHADSIVASDNHPSSDTSPAPPKQSTHQDLGPLYEALIAAYSVRHQAPEDLGRVDTIFVA
jgi:hypothetical protein